VESGGCCRKLHAPVDSKNFLMRGKHAPSSKRRRRRGRPPADSRDSGEPSAEEQKPKNRLQTPKACWMKGDRRKQACWLEESKKKAGKGKDKSSAKPAMWERNRYKAGLVV
jgi:hypothetical protein